MFSPHMYREDDENYKVFRNKLNEMIRQFTENKKLLWNNYETGDDPIEITQLDCRRCKWETIFVRKTMIEFFLIAQSQKDLLFYQ